MNSIQTLLEIMARLRDPEEGCPWDREQNFKSIAPYTIEEAYEVDDAIRRGDMEDLLSELGDLLLQVVYHSQLAAELGHFNFDDVVQAISDKLVRRHPHIFEIASTSSKGQVKRDWELIKDRERADRGARRDQPVDPLEDIPLALPALTRAAKLQGRARRLSLPLREGENSSGAASDPKGAPELAFASELSAEEVHDPWARLQVAETHGADEVSLMRDLGDALFAYVRWARARDLDAEAALRDANARFEGSLRSATKDDVDRAH